MPCSLHIVLGTIHHENHHTDPRDIKYRFFTNKSIRSSPNYSASTIEISNATSFASIVVTLRYLNGHYHQPTYFFVLASRKKVKPEMVDEL